MLAGVPFRMSVAANQQRTFLRLLAQLRPHWRSDSALPLRIKSLLAAHREFGSRDRRLYRELIYTTLRYLSWIEPLLDSQPGEAVRRVAWLAADLPATKAFRTAFADGDPPTGNKAQLLPSWFRSHCPELFEGEELETQLRRAPLWLRLQTDESEEPRVLRELESRGWSWQRSPVLADAIEVLTEADVTQSEAWREGLIEIQDLGSQFILAAVGMAPGGTWLDACAGAGGKTLQLAQLLGAGGRIEAHDIRRAALAELESRARRARMPIDHDNQEAFQARARSSLVARPRRATRFAAIRILTAPPTGAYDGVLVDAPCSGSGTWRRAPHLKWVTAEQQISGAADQQLALLHQFSRNVRAGGRLVYATCSLSRRENEEVIAAFLAEQREFRTEPLAHTFGHRLREGGLTIFPSRHNTDGFFTASLRRR
jgi:16S rRNA (cytosine967-C5)-methyltransferase